MTTTSWRRGRVIAVAVAVVVAVGLLTALLVTGDDEAGPAIVVLTTLPDTSLPERTTTTTTTLVASATVTAGGEAGLPERGGEEPMPNEGAPAVPLPPMGIATTEFDWQVMGVPGLTYPEMWFDRLLEIDGHYWAVGGGYDESDGRGRAQVWVSADGVTWGEKVLPEALASSGSPRFTVTDEGVVAVVEGWDEARAAPTLRVFLSRDGATWNEADVSAFADDGHLWISGAAGGDGALVLAGAREPPYSPPQPAVVTITRGDLVVEIDEAAGSYLITDAATGATVAHGSMDRLWSHGEDWDHEEGVAIYDTATGEIVFRTDWPALNAAAITAYDRASFGEPLVVEITSGDATLLVDDYRGSITVVGPDGTVRFAGLEEALWRGPPPTFTDAGTGEVILVVPWEEWDAAYAAAYPERGISTPATVLLRTTDFGVTWTEVDVSAITGGPFFFSDLVHGPTGFVAVGTIQPALCCEDVGGDQVVLTSGDGADWTMPATDLEEGVGLYQLQATTDGYSALGEGGRLLSSSDAATWQVVLDPGDLQLPLGTVWYEHVASGGLGTFVTGTWDGWEDPGVRPAAISRDGRTLTIDGSIYTVTDDGTGEVLARFDESETWEDAEEPLQPAETGFGWGHGGLGIYADDGTVLFAVSHRSIEGAMEGTWVEPEMWYQPEQVLLMLDDEGWTRVPLPALDESAWTAGMVVEENRVVLAVTVEEQPGLERAMKLLIAVGSPATIR